MIVFVKLLKLFEIDRQRLVLGTRSDIDELIHACEMSTLPHGMREVRERKERERRNGNRRERKRPRRVRNSDDDDKRRLGDEVRQQR